MSDFYFAVARITCAQLCRASGIDRCTPSALDVLSDVLIRYLNLLAEVAVKSAQSSGHEEVELPDVALALAELGILQNRLDPSDTSDIDEFKEWISGPNLQRAAHVARVQQQTLSALGAAQGAAIAAQQASQDVHAATAQAASSATDVNQNEVDKSYDWLWNLVNKQILMGHDKRYKNTVFGSAEADEKVIIGGGPSTLEDFYEQYDPQSKSKDDTSLEPAEQAGEPILEL